MIELTDIAAPTFAEEDVLHHHLHHLAQKPGLRWSNRVDRLIDRGWLHRIGVDHVQVTEAGYNARGIAAPGQAWGEWTIAYRTRKGKNWSTVGRRVRNWAGDWHQARGMAGYVLELLGGDKHAQVWYTSTRGAELEGRVHAEDIGHILLEDTGARLRLVETGMLPDELLDREVLTVAQAYHDAQHRTASGSWADRQGLLTTHTEAREYAAGLRDILPAADWMALVHQAGTAASRGHHSYLAQSWCTDQRPATWDQELAAQQRLDAALIALERAPRTVQQLLDAETGAAA